MLNYEALTEPIDEVCALSSRKNGSSTPRAKTASSQVVQDSSFNFNFDYMTIAEQNRRGRMVLSSTPSADRGTKGQLLEHVRHIGTLEGKVRFQMAKRSRDRRCPEKRLQVAGLNTEADFLKGRIAELQAPQQWLGAQPHWPRCPHRTP